METVATLTRRIAREGRVVWIGVRPARRAAMRALDAAEIGADGIEGDHATGARRAVTLVQAEHLGVIASLAGLDAVAPEALRRNLAVEGLNLLGLRKRRFRLGTAVLEGSGPCAPCSRMEEALGPGGYAAVRGHGGLYAAVIEPGRVALGDAVVPLDDRALRSAPSRA
ncbi:MAG: MOSC domain-containing protein [Paracoccaceae bacterium]